MRHKCLPFLAVAASVCAVATPAMAYVGPGAGLSVVGALIGVVVAVGAALLFIVGWPIRRMLRRRKQLKAREHQTDGKASSSTAR